jgi:hypothetical protein
MKALCFLHATSQGTSTYGQMRTANMNVEIDQHGNFPEFVLVPGEAIDISTFDPRRDWDAWINMTDAMKGLRHIRCIQLAGLIYVEEQVVKNYLGFQSNNTNHKKPEHLTEPRFLKEHLDQFMRIPGIDQYTRQIVIAEKRKKKDSGVRWTWPVTITHVDGEIKIHD